MRKEKVDLSVLISERTTLRVPEAAELLGVGVRTVYDLAHSADFPAFRRGKTVLIHRAKLEEWAKLQAERGMEDRQLGGFVNKG